VRATGMEEEEEYNEEEVGLDRDTENVDGLPPWPADIEYKLYN
jgi:hypothetical protein